MRALLILVATLACTSPSIALANEPTSAAALYEGKTVSHWVTELKKEDVAIRRKAAYALFKLGPAAKDAAELLAQSLGDDDVYGRAPNAGGRCGL